MAPQGPIESLRIGPVRRKWAQHAPMNPTGPNVCSIWGEKHRHLSMGLLRIQRDTSEPVMAQDDARWTHCKGTNPMDPVEAYSAPVESLHPFQTPTPLKTQQSDKKCKTTNQTCKNSTMVLGRFGTGYMSWKIVHPSVRTLNTFHS